MIKFILICLFCINCFAFKTAYTFVDNEKLKVNSNLTLAKNKLYYDDEIFVNSLINNYYLLKENGKCNSFKDFVNNINDTCSIEKEIDVVYKEYYPEFPKEVPPGTNIYRKFYFIDYLNKKEIVKVLKIIEIENIKLILFEYNK